MINTCRLKVSRSELRSIKYPVPPIDEQRSIVKYIELSAKILFEFTRNTGFEVSKGSIGECWIKSCCDWFERQDDDICGLAHSRLGIYEKMKHILDGTCLQSEFHRIGLEVIS